jgi:hypothetical protein
VQHERTGCLVSIGFRVAGYYCGVSAARVLGGQINGQDTTNTGSASNRGQFGVSGRGSEHKGFLAEVRGHKGVSQGGLTKVWAQGVLTRVRVQGVLAVCSGYIKADLLSWSGCRLSWGTHCAGLWAIAFGRVLAGFWQGTKIGWALGHRRSILLYMAHEMHKEM